MSEYEIKAAVTLCHGPECRQHGSHTLRSRLVAHGVKTVAGHCQGLCHCAPIAIIDGKQIGEASYEKIVQQLNSMSQRPGQAVASFEPDATPPFRR